MTTLVTEIDLNDECNHVRYFMIPMEMGYRQSISFNSFFNGVKKRNQSKQFLYVADSYEHLLELVALGAPISKMKLDGLKINPPIQCKDLYDFYKKIGYERKTRKYINEAAIS